MTMMTAATAAAATDVPANAVISDSSRTLMEGIQTRARLSRTAQTSTRRLEVAKKRSKRLKKAHALKLAKTI